MTFTLTIDVLYLAGLLGWWIVAGFLGVVVIGILLSVYRAFYATTVYQVQWDQIFGWNGLRCVICGPLLLPVSLLALWLDRRAGKAQAKQLQAWVNEERSAREAEEVEAQLRAAQKPASPAVP